MENIQKKTYPYAFGYFICLEVKKVLLISGIGFNRYYLEELVFEFLLKRINFARCISVDIDAAVCYSNDVCRRRTSSQCSL